METSIVSKKALLYIALFSLVIVFILAAFSMLNYGPSLEVCNSKGTLITHIRLNNSYDILINAGSDSTVNTCLGDNMPFFDKKIELLVLTDTKNAIVQGVIPLTERYSIGRIILPSQAQFKQTKALTRLLSYARKNKVKVLFLQQKSTIAPLVGYTVVINPTETEKKVGENMGMNVSISIHGDGFGALFVSDNIKTIFDKEKQTFRNGKFVGVDLSCCDCLKPSNFDITAGQKNNATIFSCSKVGKKNVVANSISLNFISIGDMQKFSLKK